MSNVPFNEIIDKDCNVYEMTCVAIKEAQVYAKMGESGLEESLRTRLKDLSKEEKEGEENSSSQGEKKRLEEELKSVKKIENGEEKLVTHVLKRAINDEIPYTQKSEKDE